MNRRIRKKLDMARRVLDFSLRHLSDDASSMLVVEQLRSVVDRMDALAAQQYSGFASVRGSSEHRRELRRQLRDRLLRHLVTIAAGAAAEAPTLKDTYRLPPANATNTTYQTYARLLLEHGQADQALLARYGLADTLLPDLEAAVQALDATVVETHQARENHIAARAGLHVLAAQVMRLVAMIDGINRYRFDRDGSLLVAWESAKHLIAEGHAEKKAEVPSAAESGSAQTGPEGVQPAA
jgi:hypothetical protein